MTSSMKQRIAQIRHGQVPKGYRLTRLGIAPNDWMMFRIGDCLERVERPVDVQANKRYTQIGIRSHGKGLFYKEPVTGAELGNKAVFWIEPNCFILNIVFAWEQAIGKTTQAEEGMIGSHRFPMYRPISNRVDTDYLIYYFLTKRGTEILEAASPGGAGRNKTLGQDRFLKSKIVLPPLAEQRKIAKILATQDRVIELLNMKIEQLKLLKKNCLRKLFPRHGSDIPEVRFRGFIGAWVQKRFGELYKKSAEKNDGSISIDRNITVATMQFKNDVHISTNEYLKSYYTFKIGDIAFEGHQSKEYRFGRFVANDIGDGIVSHIFSVFRPISRNDLRFWKYAINNEWMMCKVLSRSTKASTMMHELVEDDFLKEVCYVPGIEEQKGIGSFLTCLDNFIALNQRRCDEEEQKKKALMQLLLTGIVRVKEAAGSRFSTREGQ